MSKKLVEGSKQVLKSVSTIDMILWVVDPCRERWQIMGSLDNGRHFACVKQPIYPVYISCKSS